MKIKNSGRAIPSCGQLPLSCLTSGVVFSVPSLPFSAFVKLPDGKVYSLPSFAIEYGFINDLSTMVIPHPEAILTIAIGEYDPGNPANNYYKEGTEPKSCMQDFHVKS